MLRRIINGKTWTLIVGPDISNPNWGLTLLWQQKPPEERDGISTAWRHVWRLNFHWPISVEYRRPKSFPGRFRNTETVQKMMEGFSWSSIRTASEIEAERLAAKKS